MQSVTMPLPLQAESTQGTLLEDSAGQAKNKGTLLANIQLPPKSSAASTTETNQGANSRVLGETQGKKADNTSVEAEANEQNLPEGSKRPSLSLVKNIKVSKLPNKVPEQGPATSEEVQSNGAGQQAAPAAESHKLGTSYSIPTDAYSQAGSISMESSRPASPASSGEPSRNVSPAFHPATGHRHEVEADISTMGAALAASIGDAAQDGGGNRLALALLRARQAVARADGIIARGGGKEYGTPGPSNASIQEPRRPPPGVSSPVTNRAAPARSAPMPPPGVTSTGRPDSGSTNAAAESPPPAAALQPPRPPPGTSSPGQSSKRPAAQPADTPAPASAAKGTPPGPPSVALGSGSQSAETEQPPVPPMELPKSPPPRRPPSLPSAAGVVASPSPPHSARSAQSQPESATSTQISHFNESPARQAGQSGARNTPPARPAQNMGGAAGAPPPSTAQTLHSPPPPTPPATGALNDSVSTAASGLQSDTSHSSAHEPGAKPSSPAADSSPPEGSQAMRNRRLSGASDSSSTSSSISVAASAASASPREGGARGLRAAGGGAASPMLSPAPPSGGSAAPRAEAPLKDSSSSPAAPAAGSPPRAKAVPPPPLALDEVKSPEVGAPHMAAVDPPSAAKHSVVANTPQQAAPVQPAAAAGPAAVATPPTGAAVSPAPALPARGNRAQSQARSAVEAAVVSVMQQVAGSGTSNSAIPMKVRRVNAGGHRNTIFATAGSPQAILPTATATGTEMTEARPAQNDTASSLPVAAAPVTAGAAAAQTSSAESKAPAPPLSVDKLRVKVRLIGGKPHVMVDASDGSGKRVPMPLQQYLATVYTPFAQVQAQQQTPKGVQGASTPPSKDASPPSAAPGSPPALTVAGAAGASPSAAKPTVHTNPSPHPHTASTPRQDSTSTKVSSSPKAALIETGVQTEGSGRTVAVRGTWRSAVHHPRASATATSDEEGGAGEGNTPPSRLPSRKGGQQVRVQGGGSAVSRAQQSKRREHPDRRSHSRSQRDHAPRGAGGNSARVSSGEDDGKAGGFGSTASRFGGGISRPAPLRRGGGRGGGGGSSKGRRVQDLSKVGPRVDTNHRGSSFKRRGGPAQPKNRSRSRPAPGRGSDRDRRAPPLNMHASFHAGDRYLERDEEHSRWRGGNRTAPVPAWGSPIHGQFRDRDGDDDWEGHDEGAPPPGLEGGRLPPNGFNGEYDPPPPGAPQAAPRHRHPHRQAQDDASWAGGPGQYDREEISAQYDSAASAEQEAEARAQSLRRAAAAVRPDIAHADALRSRVMGGRRPPPEPKAGPPSSMGMRGMSPPPQARPHVPSPSPPSPSRKGTPPTFAQATSGGAPTLQSAAEIRAALKARMAAAAAERMRGGAQKAPPSHPPSAEGARLRQVATAPFGAFSPSSSPQKQGVARAGEGRRPPTPPPPPTGGHPRTGGTDAAEAEADTSDAGSMCSAHAQNTAEFLGLSAPGGGAVSAVSLASVGGASRSSSAPRGEAVTPVDELHVTVGNVPSSLQAVEHTMSDRQLSSMARQTGALTGLVASARELPAAALDNLDSLASRITRSASVDKSAKGTPPGGLRAGAALGLKVSPPPLRSVVSAGSLRAMEGGLGGGAGGAQYRQRSHTGTLSPLSIAQSPGLHGGEGPQSLDELHEGGARMTPPKPISGGASAAQTENTPFSPAAAVASMAASLAEDTTVAAIIGALNSPTRRGPRKGISPPPSPSQGNSSTAFDEQPKASGKTPVAAGKLQSPLPPDAGEGGAGGFEYGPTSTWAWSVKDSPPTQDEHPDSPTDAHSADSKPTHPQGGGHPDTEAPPQGRPQARQPPSNVNTAAQPHFASSASALLRAGGGVISSTVHRPASPTSPAKFARLSISSNPPAPPGQAWAPPPAAPQYGAPPSLNLGGTRTLQRKYGPDGGGIFFTSAPPAPLPLPDGETVAQLLAESKPRPFGNTGGGASTVPSAGMSVDALTPPQGRGVGAPGVSSQAPIVAHGQAWVSSTAAATAASTAPSSSTGGASSLPPWLIAARTSQP